MIRRLLIWLAPVASGGLAAVSLWLRGTTDSLYMQAVADGRVNQFIAVTLTCLMILPMAVVVTTIREDRDSMEIFGHWYVPLVIAVSAVFAIALIGTYMQNPRALAVALRSQREAGDKRASEG